MARGGKDDHEMKTRLPMNRGSSLFKQDPYTRLLNALRQREYRTFKRLLEYDELDPDHYYGYDEYKTCLDVACSETGMSEFVTLLLDHKADVNKVNETHNKAPIHFAVETGDVVTVKVLLDDPRINVNLLSKGNTALHSAIKYIKDLDVDRDTGIEKYEEIVKLLLKAGTDVNIPDLKHITPIYSAANQGLETIVKYIIEYAKHPIDVDTYKDRRQRNARTLIEDAFPYLLDKLPPPKGVEKNVDVHRLFSHLSGHDEDSFVKDLKRVKDKEEAKRMLAENNGLYTLLQFACTNGMSQAVQAILEKGADPNLTAPGNNMKPVALACCGGYHKILSLLASNESTSFEPINGDSLLQLTIKEDRGPGDDTNVDYRICKQILMSGARTNPDINFTDIKDNTALHYATKCGDHDTVLDLLRRGAYIGIRNKFDDPPLADISPRTLETYLDECITTNNERPNDENYELRFNYSFLVPPNCAIDRDSSCKTPLMMNDSSATKNTAEGMLTPETDVLLYMTRHPELKKLLKHPIITSFLYLKWQRISCMFYANITFYALFWLSLILYILLGYAEERDQTAIDIFKVMTTIGVIILAIRETMQMIVSPRRYYQSFENWLEIALILATVVILTAETYEKRHEFCAFAILLSSAELVLLIGQFPSLSTYIMMLKTVTQNFFKFLLWYFILIVAFALSFYTLFKTVEKDGRNDESKPFNPNKCDDDEETDFFLDPGMSLFKTFVMLTGEFDAGSIKFESVPGTSHLIFILFVFMIPIVLFNLLNGLAVSDTQSIRADAELVSIVCRIKLISYFESILLGDMVPYKNVVSSMQNACCWLPGHTCIKPRMICIRPMAKRICLFPEYLPAAQINVKTNQSSKVEIKINDKKNETDDDVESSLCCLKRCCDLHMDKTIVKAAKNIIDDKKAETNDIQKIKERLDSLEKLTEQIYAILKNK